MPSQPFFCTLYKVMSYTRLQPEAVAIQPLPYQWRPNMSTNGSVYNLTAGGRRPNASCCSSRLLLAAANALAAYRPLAAP